jgi:putative methionine-R-sulfoxide reductase with GAF domain
MEQKAEHKFNQYLNHIHKIMGHNRSTYANELQHFSKKMFKHKFKGVYASDKYPKLKKNQSMIINVDKSNEPGSHWLGVYCYDNNRYLIFDSFGRPSVKLIPHFGSGINLMDTDYDKNQLKSQSDCGQRCIAFLNVCHNDGFKYAKLI